MEKLKVKVIKLGSNALPQYETELSAGCDLRANIVEPIALLPMERRLIPCGIKIELPEGYYAQVCPRSGLSLRHGITILNSPGVIDFDYRGQIHACLINLGHNRFTVNPGDRVAQLVIARYEQAEFIESDTLSSTDRGEGGHGSTGVK